jgi:hypothetical protein
VTRLKGRGLHVVAERESVLGLRRGGAVGPGGREGGV